MEGREGISTHPSINSIMSKTMGECKILTIKELLEEKAKND